MPVADQWKGFERQPRYCGTRLNKAYMPPEKSFLRRRPFNNINNSSKASSTVLLPAPKAGNAVFLPASTLYTVELTAVRSKHLKKGLLVLRGPGFFVLPRDQTYYIPNIAQNSLRPNHHDQQQNTVAATNHIICNWL